MEIIIILFLAIKAKQIAKLLNIDTSLIDGE